jgi:hypothetical protein
LAATICRIQTFQSWEDAADLMVYEEDKKHGWSTHDDPMKRGLYLYVCGGVRSYGNDAGHVTPEMRYSWRHSGFRGSRWQGEEAEKVYRAKITRKGQSENMRNSMKLCFVPALECARQYFNMDSLEEKMQCIGFLQMGMTRGSKVCVHHLAQITGTENLDQFLALMNLSMTCDEKDPTAPSKSFEIAKALFDHGKSKEGCLVMANTVLTAPKFSYYMNEEWLELFCKNVQRVLT